jgi:hypothetical protein
MTLENELVLSRRRLLGAAGSVVIAATAIRLRGGRAGLTFGGLAPRPAEGPRTLADFAPHVGSRFDVRVGKARAVPFTLVDAVDRPARGQGGARVDGEAFSLLFVADLPTAMPSATYTLSHPTMGRFPLLLTPVGPASSSQRYEAVVNHHALTR